MIGRMQLYRLRIIPRSPWRTPWHADTLTGLLCAVCARTRGPDVLRSNLIEPMLAGKPPFVLSDAFPGDMLPLPAILRVMEWPDGTDLKFVKRARWLSRDGFEDARAGRRPAPNHLRCEDAVLQTEVSRHNTLARDSDASLEEGGLFSRADTLYRSGQDGDAWFSLYFRACDDNATGLLFDLLQELALIGFGADIATGRGQFDIAANAEPMPELDTAPDGANAAVRLSTFQPGPTDPTDGLWEAFPKFGKLGPDLALSDVRKRALILFRPGACFRVAAPRPYLGRAIPMDQVVPRDTAAELRARKIDIIHPAFGLAVPARLSWEAAA